MANNPYVNKVGLADGTTLIDLTTDTAIASDVAQGKYFHLATGERVQGTASGGGDYIRTVVCPQQNFTVPSGSTYVMLSNADRLIAGDEYVVTYDGVEYFCTSTELWGSDRFIGDLVVTWGNYSSDYIFPFCVEDWNSNPGPAVYARDNSQHSIKIEHLELLTTGTTLVPKTVTANGTYDPEDDNADGYSEVTVNVPSSGASNVVTGTFKGTTTGAAMDVTLNYTGSGYPIAVVIYPEEGPYNSDTGTFYSTIQRYAVSTFIGIKNRLDTPPTYPTTTTVTADTRATVLRAYKNSTSSATTYNSGSSLGNSGVGLYQDLESSHTTTGANSVKFRSNKKMSVFIADTSYGFMANINYKYWVIYSS